MPAIVSRLWDVAVLACLRERPMHPYEIQRVLRTRRKDDVLVLKRGSLYEAIARLGSADAAGT
jgi:DNA-binding PadR family transcriptional regulator